MEETRRERKKRLTRQRIAMVAVALFAEQGYEETTVAQIAAAADVDPKTFFNYFRSKDDVLFADLDHIHELLLGAIVRRHPDEGPGEVLVRMVQDYAARRRPEVTPKRPEELSAWSRLVMSTPALQAKGLYVMLDLQRRIAEALLEAFPGELDPVTAAAMTGSLIGAIQQTTLESVRLGRTQDEMWEASRRAVEVAARGLLSVRPSAEGP
ncbi:TetR family transcriptional regulator [Nonomuraea sp. SMC257]|uniref:TetR family transcriptional regulator n=1 Tax=Nonomuraea montanisoli TaxID=2741721 RepID=A0A7Y6IHQ0_9ACTN|nr:TetR/AcrR family transcriptional regulator [Nonomuraea montanisoli]NUW37855.1 TetR family transcriptional regulator [Nonomuraea montanisoli]